MLKFSGIGNGQQSSHLIAGLHLNLSCIRKKEKRTLQTRLKRVDLIPFFNGADYSWHFNIEIAKMNGVTWTPVKILL